MASLGRSIGGREAVGRGEAVGSRRLPLPSLNGWVVGAIVVLAMGAALPVIQSSAATSRGFDLRAIEQRQADLRGEIAALEAAIGEESSLERVRLRAQRLGLRPASAPIVVEVDVPGPEPARVPAEYLPEAAPAPEQPDSWWQSLLRWLPLPD